MKQNLRIHVHIDLRKFLLYNAIEFVFWFYLCLSYLTLLGRYNVEVAHIAAFIPSVFFLVKNWRVFLKKHSFSIYDGGIAFDRLGFWEWKDVEYKRQGLKHRFALDYTDKDIAQEQFRYAKHKYTDGSGRKIMLLYYEYPPFSATFSGREIAACIKKNDCV